MGAKVKLTIIKYHIHKIGSVVVAIAKPIDKKHTKLLFQQEYPLYSFSPSPIKNTGKRERQNRKTHIGGKGVSWILFGA
jgi:hypothetical protein